MGKKQIKSEKDLRGEFEPGYYSAGVRGLYLAVAKGGTRSWLFRYRLFGKIREMGLGSLQWMTLAKARAYAAEQGALVAQKKDPIDTRRAEVAQKTAALEVARAAAMTFDECAEKYIAAQRAGWKNEKHAQQWTNTLATYASPVFGKRPVNAVDTEAVLEVLTPLWETKTETATRLRERIERVLDWAAFKGHRSGENPARWRGHLDKELASPAKIKRRTSRNQPALPFEQMPAFMTALRQREGVAVLALEFAILTTARTSEVLGATWNELDLTKKLWTIPGGRMKMENAHEVSLSARAVEIVKMMKKAKTCEYVFPSAKDEPLSDAALLAVVKRMNGQVKGKRPAPAWFDPKQGNAPIVPHGFRSSFSTWAAESRQDRDVAEMCLAHAVGSDVERRYNRAELRDARRRLLDTWADFCGGAA